MAAQPHPHAHRIAAAQQPPELSPAASSNTATTDPTSARTLAPVWGDDRAFSGDSDESTRDQEHRVGGEQADVDGLQTGEHAPAHHPTERRSVRFS
jgi:hypothetical protein